MLATVDDSPEPFDETPRFGQKKPRKKRRALTRGRIEQAALRHLQRHPASKEQLRRVLLRRVDRTLKDHPDADVVQWKAWVEEVIVRCEEYGYVNDARFAESKTRSLRRRGASARKIRSALQQRGVASEHVAASFEAEEGDAELEAAKRLAQRRRFGQWRRGEGDADVRRKELAAMGRAGFSYGVAKKALEEHEDEE